MKFNPYLYIFFVGLVLFYSCRNEEKRPCRFYFTLNYPGDTKENHKTALLWALSYLGAELPLGSFDKALSWTDTATFEIDFKKAGFNDKSIESLNVICDSLVASPLYKKHDAADIGAFIALTIGCSYHYYKITGAPENFGDLVKMKRLDPERTFMVTKSAVAKHHRRMRYPDYSNDPLNWIFIAEESQGDLLKNSFSAEFFEVFDVMRNGQLRFMIYGKDGKLVSASPKLLGEAGKPAKCIWCHEIVIQPLFEKTDSVQGSLSPLEFQVDVERFMKRLAAYRDSLHGDVDFSKTQDHTQMELEYISYMSPNIRKLSAEWRISEHEARKIVSALKFAAHDEFKFLGEVIKRSKLKDAGTLFPEDIREPNAKEINFLK